MALLNVNSILTGGLALAAAAGWLLFFFSRGEVEKLRNEAAVAKKNAELCIAELERASREFERNLEIVRANCEDEKKILKEELERKIKACKAMLEREKRLKEKLEEIDEL